MATGPEGAQTDSLLRVLREITARQGLATASSLALQAKLSRQIVDKILSVLIRQGVVEFVGALGRTRAYRLASTDSPSRSTLGPDSTASQPPRPPAPPPPHPSASGPAGGDDAPGSASGGRRRASFEPHDLDPMIISLPLQKLLADWQTVVETGAPPGDPRFLEIASWARIKDGFFTIIVDLNSAYPGGVTRARERVLDLLAFVALGQAQAAERVTGLRTLAPRHLREISNQYLIVHLTPEHIGKLVALDRNLPETRAAVRSPSRLRAIHRLWPDNLVQRQTFASTATIKADAARNSFGCTGRGIVWAVADSGIDGTHPHFARYRNLEGLPPGVAHQDFVSPDRPEPLVDRFGHGTHVAGIIAGGCVSQEGRTVKATVYERDEKGRRVPMDTDYEEILGVAPECKLLSLKVLGEDGTGGVTEVMAALEQVIRMNGYGKTIVVHGINLSLGYVYDPQWYACGHSPLCEVVDRLSRSGVCVVVAAGNSGYGDMDTKFTGTRAQGMSMSINDPGNAERAITVGSTHREAPHTYGVSYFSSKGPTGDGRAKPDLLAPGEKIVSCRSLSVGTSPSSNQARDYVEDSGTSMAAPHVSGAIAALLSVRREFIGKSDEVKRVLMSSALDLGRERTMQGSGLLNLFSALQSI